jgi:mRNA interferase RelE/StbE
MYEIIFTKKAIEEFNKLESAIKERIWGKIKLCKEDPFRFLKHLTEVDGFKLRIGDYRAIADVDNSSKTIKILKVGHRRNIYER